MSTYRMDDAGLFLSRQLEYIRPSVFEIEYTDIKYASVVPVNSEAGPAAASYTYRVFDAQGDFAFIQDKADDLPRADIVVKETTFAYKSIGGSFGYTLQEIRAAQMANLSLEQRRAAAVRRAYEETVNKIAFFGDTGTNLAGMLNNTSVDKYTVQSTKWFDQATADEMLEVLNQGVNAIVSGSNMKEQPDTILVPYSVYQKITTTPRSTTSDTTVAQFFLATNPFISNIEPLNELEASKSGGNLSKDRLVFYRRDPMKVEFHLPQPLEFFDPQQRGLEFIVPAHARVGGTALYYPKSMLYMDKA